MEYMLRKKKLKVGPITQKIMSMLSDDNLSLIDIQKILYFDAEIFFELTKITIKFELEGGWNSVLN